MDDEALVAEFNDDPSPASMALVEIVVRVHDRARATFTATGTVARFRREVRVRSYLADGWRGYVRALRGPRPAVTGPPVQTIPALLEEFERDAEPLLFNNLVLAQQVALGAEPEATVETEADRLTAALAALAAGALDHDAFVETFGHHALVPYELSEPRYGEMDGETLRKVAGLAPRWDAGSKRDLDELLAGRDAADAGVLIAVRELARSQALRIVADLRSALLQAAADAAIDDVFARPIEDTLALLGQRAVSS